MCLSLPVLDFTTQRPCSKKRAVQPGRPEQLAQARTPGYGQCMHTVRGVYAFHTSIGGLLDDYRHLNKRGDGDRPKWVEMTTDSEPKG
jgi:hypothetical protein